MSEAGSVAKKVRFPLWQQIMVGLVIAFPQMVMVYKAGESTVDPTKVQILVPRAEEAPAVPGLAPGTAPTEEQKEKADEKADDDAAKSMQDAFKAPAETKK